MNATSKVVAVAVPAPLYQTYDYQLAPQDPGKNDQQERLIGRRVAVEFGHRGLIGIIVEVREEAHHDQSALKTAQLFKDEEPVFSKDMLATLLWASTYYCHPLGECFHAALPSMARKKATLPTLRVRKWHRTPKPFEGRANATHQKQILDLVASHRDGIWEDALRLIKASPGQLKLLEQKGYLEFSEHVHFSATQRRAAPDKALSLNPEQQKVYESLHALNGFSPALLEGITGSGKTEVYIRLVEEYIKQGRQALILIPEINLSPQTFARFQSKLSEAVVLVHSALGDKEKYQAWQMARLGHAKVVIGTRSAIFTPFKALGLIIVDEEHDNSYKQNDGFKYSARDLAVKRAQQQQCPVILGTATPSLETLYKVEQGHYSYQRLNTRAGNASLPDVALIDIRSRPLTDGLSPPLLKAIGDTLEAGNQVIVFQNRRGYAPTLMCESCGTLVQCPNCDARLTVHSHPPHLHCHHCDLKTDIPKQCSSCHGVHFAALGAGTERIESSLAQRFSEYDIVRLDRDTIKNPTTLNHALNKIHEGSPAMIVGTQMLSKGHDFHNVTLVAVLDADGLFFSADFRAIEKGAQQLIQLAGRTGRGDKQGQVLIQTRLPEHPLFQYIGAHDYHACALEQLQERMQCQLPPHLKMISIRADARDVQSTLDALSRLNAALANSVSALREAQVIGPIEASMTRKQGIFRSYLTILHNNPSARRDVLLALPAALHQAKSRGVRFAIDVDPIEYM